MANVLDVIRGPGSSGLAAWRAWRRFAATQPILGRLGPLEARLAATTHEIRLAQALRYQVFYRELAARPRAVNWLTGRDADRWDRICDHLLVFDRSEPGSPIVATYRLLRAAMAARAGTGFYTESEFDIPPILDRFAGLEFMELGRSCVLPQWRNKRTIELLWHGSWSYVRSHAVDVMFGCASFAGADPHRHREALSYLRAHAAPDADWDIRAQPGRAADIGLIPPGRIDLRRAMGSLPPLIKGYLRLGAWIGRDAVVDRQFGTTDVLIILPVNRINPRYVNYYGADANRHAVDE